MRRLVALLASAQQLQSVFFQFLGIFYATL